MDMIRAVLIDFDFGTGASDENLSNFTNNNIIDSNSLINHSGINTNNNNILLGTSMLVASPDSHENRGN